MSHTRVIMSAPNVPPMRPRLVLHADCTACGRLNGEDDDPFGVSQLALDHTNSTGHVVILKRRDSYSTPQFNMPQRHYDGDVRSVFLAWALGRLPIPFCRHM
jgi:hypothetical protein